MKLTFPPDFIFGTSTAAYQIETAFEHDWKGIKARDGHLFDRTTDHELRVAEDVKIISSLAPNYRMSLMWSKLQREPMAKFDPNTVAFYHDLLRQLKQENVNIMMVLHHFTNPLWFARQGGWKKESNIKYWVDFCEKLVNEFGHYVSLWNTFNEPNLYASFAYAIGAFPPFDRNLFSAVKVIKNIAKAHNQVYDLIKEQYPSHPVGISHNAAIFSHENVLGWFPAKVLDLWFMDYIPGHFSKVDFFGISYYAKISHDPFPITFIQTPEKLRKLQRDHDDMWEYYPQGLKETIDRYWKQYHMPIIITENGVCSADDSKRVKAIWDYMTVLHTALKEGVDIRGYYHWSPWDNFEWNLGPTYRFGLYECDVDTKERVKRPSADVYASLAYSKEISPNSLHPLLV